MARPQKTGLDYFPLDTTWDRTMRLIEARYKLLGIGCIVTLYQDIYREGYALDWDEDTQMLFGLAHGIEQGLLSSIVAFALEKGIFDADIFHREGVLTSRGIQKRWSQIVHESKRGSVEIDPSVSLLRSDSGNTPEETRLTPEETPVSTRGNPLITPQRKGKESKGKERKEEETDFPLVLSAWFKRYQAETAITRAPSRGQGSEFEAALALEDSYDEDTLLAAVDHYWATWPRLWFAVRKGDMKRPETQRKGSHFFKSFASRIDEVIQDMTALADTGEDAPF